MARDGLPGQHLFGAVPLKTRLLWCRMTIYWPPTVGEDLTALQSVINSLSFCTSRKAAWHRSSRSGHWSRACFPVALIIQKNSRNSSWPLPLTSSNHRCGTGLSPSSARTCRSSQRLSRYRWVNESPPISSSCWLAASTVLLRVTVTAWLDIAFATGACSKVSFAWNYETQWTHLELRGCHAMQITSLYPDVRPEQSWYQNLPSFLGSLSTELSAVSLLLVDLSLMLFGISSVCDDGCVLGLEATTYSFEIVGNRFIYLSIWCYLWWGMAAYLLCKRQFRWHKGFRLILSFVRFISLLL